MRQIIFSTRFPATHPRKGEKTYFVEKIWAGLTNDEITSGDIDFKDFKMDFLEYAHGKPKLHTIRKGQRWKEGYEFVGKIWSGKPYRSKTITVTPVLRVEKIYYIEIIILSGVPRVRIGNKEMVFGNFIDDQLAVNDGLSYMDFVGWFQKPFSGQVICWSKKVNY